MTTIRVGERITISGIKRKIPNPAYRWWKPWLPKLVDGPDCQPFVISAVAVDKLVNDTEKP